MPSTKTQHDSKTTTPTTKRRTTRRKKTTTTAAAAAVTAAVQADAIQAEPETFGAWAMFKTAEEAEADAASILCKWAPLAGMPGKKQPEWLTLAGLPQNKHGRCIEGTIGAVARRAIADVVTGAVPVAVPVFFSVMAPDGEQDVDNEEHLTTSREDARTMRGDTEPQPIGFLPSSGITPRLAAAVQAAAGVNVDKKTVSGAVSAVAKWAGKWKSEAEVTDDIKAAGDRRALVLARFGSDDKDDQRAVNNAKSEARDTNTVARIKRKHGAAVIEAGCRRADAPPVEAPVKRPVSV